MIVCPRCGEAHKGQAGAFLAHDLCGRCKRAFRKVLADDVDVCGARTRLTRSADGWLRVTSSGITVALFSTDAEAEDARWHFDAWMRGAC